MHYLWLFISCICFTASGGNVYVVDTGLRYSHVEFSGSAVPFYDFEGGNVSQQITRKYVCAVYCFKIKSALQCVTENNLWQPEINKTVILHDRVEIVMVTVHTLGALLPVQLLAMEVVEHTVSVFWTVLDLEPHLTLLMVSYDDVRP